MQVSVESTSDLERRVTVEVPAEKLETAIDAKLKEAQKSVRIDGFRPGKVPMREVRRRFGQAVREDVLNEVMRNSFVEAIEQEKLEPAGMPTFEPTRNETGQNFEFVATFEVYPSVEVAGFDTIEVEKPVSDISDDDVDQMIEQLRKQRSEFSEVDRAAQDGDQVVIDYKGLREGEAFDGGTAENQNLVLGSNSMIPGFEDGIVGMKAGEEKTIDVTFPEDYQAEELKGQPVKFEIKVHKVEARELPEVDEAFMESFGVKEGGIDAFKAEIRQNMERELKQAVKNRVKEQVMSGLINANEFSVPAALVSSEIQRMRQQMVQQFGGGAQGFDSSLLPDDLFQEQAERSVRLGLLFRSLLEKNEMKADTDRVKGLVEEIASQYEQPEEVVNYYYANPQQLQQVESAVLEEQVVELILEGAKVTEKEVSYEEAVRPSQPES